MIIYHDTSYVKPSNAKWIAKGYAMEDIYSLRLQFLYTEAQQEENRMAHAAGIRDTVQLRQAAEHRNAVMVRSWLPLLIISFATATQKRPAPPPANGWEVYFWCNNFSNTAHGCGLR